MLRKITFLFIIIIIILIMGILLPALQRYRPSYPMPTSARNLKQIGILLHTFAKDNNDVFPVNLEQIEYYIKYPEIFSSPEKPEDFDGPSYIYVSDHSFKDTLAQKENIIVHENTEYCDDKINVLFVDGHVEILARQDFLEKLEVTYEHLGKPMPEIKFKN